MDKNKHKQTDNQPALARKPQTTGPEQTRPGLADALRAPTQPAAAMQLQRAAGNRATRQLLQRAPQQAQAEPGTGLDGGEVSSDLSAKINAGKQGGMPLDSHAGRDLGARFGADFSNVRVHADAQADSLNRSLNAEAFTHGSDVFFSQGSYSPGTASGKQLLAHELSHVVQQNGGAARPQAKLTVGASDDRYEREADATARRVLSQPAPTLDREQDGVQRKAIPITRIQRHVSGASVQRKSKFAKRGKDVKKTAKKQDADFWNITKGPEYLAAAQKFERDLGSYAYNHPKAKNASQKALARMKHFLIGDIDMANDDYGKMIGKGVFGKNDKGSAGQVGKDIGAVIDVLNGGNLREQMTAFYNTSLGSFKFMVSTMLKHKEYDKMQQLGLNTPALKKQRKFMTKSPLNKLLGFAEKKKRGHNEMFGNDLFATDPTKFVSSGQSDILSASSARAPAHGWDKGAKPNTSERTVGDLDDLKAPLSDRELKMQFGDRADTEDLTDEKLNWVEGGTFWKLNEDSGWVKKIRDQAGMPVLTGPSGTTNRLLDVYKWLKVDGVSPEEMRLALLGWMLTSNDHSFHEIMSMAATKGLGLDYAPGPQSFHNIKPLSLRELRKISSTGRLPDEEVYANRMKSGDLKLAGGDEEMEAVEDSGDKAIQQRLSDSAGAAIATYTGPAYVVQNPLQMGLPNWLIRWVVKYQMVNKDEMAGFKEAYKKGELSIGELIREARMHNQMTNQALLELPPWTGTVYRGDWTIAKWRMKKGKKQSFKSFTSTTTVEDTAKGFADGAKIGSKVLYEMNVTNGRNVDPISVNAGEDEILLPPNSTFEVAEKPKQDGDYFRVKLNQVGGVGTEDKEEEQDAKDSEESSEEGNVPTVIEGGTLEIPSNKKVTFESMSGGGDIELKDGTKIKIDDENWPNVEDWAKVMVKNLDTGGYGMMFGDDLKAYYKDHGGKAATTDTKATAPSLPPPKVVPDPPAAHSVHMLYSPLTVNTNKGDKTIPAGMQVMVITSDEGEDGIFLESERDKQSGMSIRGTTDAEAFWDAATDATTASVNDTTSEDELDKTSMEDTFEESSSTEEEEADIKSDMKSSVKMLTLKVYATMGGASQILTIPFAEKDMLFEGMDTGDEDWVDIKDMRDQEAYYVRTEDFNEFMSAK